MEATITTIGDVFKQQIKESVKQPTIWIDYYGNRHEDTTYEWIYVYEKKLVWETVPPEGEDQFKIYHDMDLVDNKFIRVPLGLGVYGTIIQVGSHVKKCGRLFDPYIDKFKPSQFDSSRLTDVFKYATSLEETKELFYMAHFLDSNPKLPEDLFWNCPNLKEVSYAFACTNITKIPENLFARNPKLENIRYCFAGCSDIKEIPEKLFKNNQNLNVMTGAFQQTWVEEIPYGLLEHFKDNIDKITVLDCFKSTRIASRYEDECDALGLYLGTSVLDRPYKPLDKLKKEGIVPDYLSNLILSMMIAP